MFPAQGSGSSQQLSSEYFHLGDPSLPQVPAWESVSPTSHLGDLSFPGLQLRCPCLPAVPCLGVLFSPVFPAQGSVSLSHRPRCPHRPFGVPTDSSLAVSLEALSPQGLCRPGLQMSPEPTHLILVSPQTPSLWYLHIPADLGVPTDPITSVSLQPLSL